LKKIDLGSSVVVSGLFQQVDECLKKINLRPHTVQFSLGVFGRVDRLPEEKMLEITTMCGHHLISPRLVKKLVKDVKADRITTERAAELLGKQCICGAFNKARATKLIEAYSMYDET
jgi:acetylglutamate kinase